MHELRPLSNPPARLPFVPVLVLVPFPRLVLFPSPQDDDLDGLTPAEAELYLFGAADSCVNVTLSDPGSANRGNLRVVPLQRQLTDADGEFPAAAGAGSRVAGETEGDGDGSVVRLVLDGNFESLLEGDQAAQQVYGIRLGADVAQSLQVEKSRVAVVALQSGSIRADVLVRTLPGGEGEALPQSDGAGSKDAAAGEESRSAFARGPQRTATDMAEELVAQANNPLSALRLLRADLRSGTLLTPGGAAAAGGDAYDSDTGYDDFRHSAEAERAPPTLSGALGARAEQVAGRGDAGAAEDDDEEDDGIPLDLPREEGGGDGFGRRPAGNESDEEEVNG